MESIDNRATLAAIFAELAKGNSEPFLAGLAEGVRWKVTGRTSWSRTFTGKPAVLAELLGPLRERLAAPLRVAARRILVDGDFAVVEAEGEGVTRSGERYDNTYCWVIRLEGGRMIELTEYMDTELVARVLGELTPAAGTA